MLFGGAHYYLVSINSYLGTTQFIIIVIAIIELRKIIYNM